MFPVLIRIGPLTIHTYGFMIAIGFLLGFWLAAREAKRIGVPHEPLADVGFAAVLAGIVGSRIVYVMTNWPVFAGRPFDMIKIWEGGLVFYGGVIAAVPAAIWVARRKGLPVWRTADIWAPSLAIAHAVGRIGCFCAGCCHGSPVQDLPWAVTFTHPETLAIQGVPLHPTQLYESFAEVLNFSLLFFFFRPRKTFDGQLFWIYMLNYSIIRVVTEQYRGDLVRGFIIPGISTSTAISAALFVTALAFLLILRKRREGP